jgi:dTDP-4-dehydrorhamnose 3,5-epimerase
VATFPLNVFADERGAVLHMFRNDHPWFARFGEVYFSEVNPGVIKAWKRHREMTQHFAVPSGKIRLVVFDDRPDSPTRGSHRNIHAGAGPTITAWCGCLLAYGTDSKGEPKDPSLLANCTDLPHDPNESENKDLHDPSIPFSW